MMSSTVIITFDFVHLSAILSGNIIIYFHLKYGILLKTFNGNYKFLNAHKLTRNFV